MIWIMDDINPFSCLLPTWGASICSNSNPNIQSRRMDWHPISPHLALILEQKMLGLHGKRQNKLSLSGIKLMLSWAGLNPRCMLYCKSIIIFLRLFLIYDIFET
jgi:hypothetical protein